MTRYRSKNPALRQRQEAVYKSVILSRLPMPKGPWRVVSRDLRELSGQGGYAEARELAGAIGDGAMVLLTTYPLPPEPTAERRILRGTE
ncbi:MAG TPA: hypothetical protein VGK73_08815 [Polyangiaceae bacterium]